jgi:hypothetical protein
MRPTVLARVKSWSAPLNLGDCHEAMPYAALADMPPAATGRPSTWELDMRLVAHIAATPIRLNFSAVSAKSTLARYLAVSAAVPTQALVAAHRSKLK